MRLFRDWVPLAHHWTPLNPGEQAEYAVAYQALVVYYYRVQRYQRLRPEGRWQQSEQKHRKVLESYLLDRGVSAEIRTLAEMDVHVLHFSALRQLYYWWEYEIHIF